MKNNPPPSQNLMVLFILLLCLITDSLSCSPTSPRNKYHISKYIRVSCRQTLYPKLCQKSLAKYATEIKTSPKLLATTALLVTFNTTHSVSKRLRKLSVNRALKLKPGEIQALLECVEEVSDSVYELRKSIKELNDSRKGPEFELRMSDVQTWVSAALTDDDTCMDDFTTRGKVKVLVRRFVVRIARLTSIALAFINNYAAV
ncbi:pectinesterase inhibitor 10-like [Sesamum indicum]|uniref:Pectinesterase inhibitor 10-like n=1 Tax=Sesamum indicum TaxID=4182 RepID=A0A6I9TC66_SESIN|nr:pectinesterase inhibitor 10-like [Sesamum indicum]